MKKKNQTDKEMHQQTMFLIKEVNEFVRSLGEHLSEEGYSEKSRTLASKIMKEWAESVNTGKTHYKKFDGANKTKYANLIKNLAEFIEK